MKENYQKTLDFIIEHEGEKVHKVKGDSGGLTAYGGLTLNTMKVLKLDLNGDGIVNEKDVYLVNKEVIDKAFRKHFWDKINGDNLPSGIDLILTDVAWNSGIGKARQFQREGYAINIRMLTDRRKIFYEYQSNLPGKKKFLKGWLNRASDAYKAAKECV